MKKINFFVLIIFMIINFSAFSTKNLVGYNVYPFLSETLPGNGLLMEIINEGFNATGIGKQTLTIYPLKRALDNFINDECLGFVGAFSAIPEKIINEKGLPIKIFNIRLVFFSYQNKKKLFIYDSVKDLKKYRIAILSGYSLIDELKRKGIELDLTHDTDQLIKKIREGRADACIISDVAGWELIKKLYPDEVNKFSMSKSYLVTPVGIILNKNLIENQTISKKLEEGLKIIKNNGLYQKMLEKYYQKGIPLNEAMIK